MKWASILFVLAALLLNGCGVAPTSSSTPNQATKKETKQATILFTMDDGWETQYSAAYPILKKYGLKGNIAVIPSKVDKPNYITLDQLHTLYNDQWDMIDHTYDHVHLDTLPKSKQQQEIISAKKWLDLNGFTRASNMVAYPFGGYNQNTLDIMKQDNFALGRTITSGFEKDLKADRYYIKVINLANYVTVKKAENRIDQAIGNGSTIVFMFHKIEHETSSMDFDPAKLDQVAAYVGEKQKEKQVQVLTLSEWVKQSGS